MKLYAIGEPYMYDDGLCIEERYAMTDWQQLYTSEEDVYDAAYMQSANWRDLRPVPYEGEYWEIEMKDGTMVYTWCPYFKDYIAEWHDPLRISKGVII